MASHKAEKVSFKRTISSGFLFAALFLCISCGSSKQAAVSPTPAPAAQDPTQPKMANGEQVLLTFCMDEAYDKPGEYMAGLGIAEDRPDRSRAITDANRVAIADIASRYIGMLKNAIEDYSKDVNVPSGKKMYESELEGGAQVIGTKVIDKYANVVCRKLSQSATGGYVGYVAVHVLLEDAKKDLPRNWKYARLITTRRSSSKRWMPNWQRKRPDKKLKWMPCNKCLP